MGISDRYEYRINDTGLSESRLWVDFLEGNSQAFEALYESYFNKLYNYGFHLCSDKNLVEDCIQELFLDLWNNRKNLNLANSVKYYLLKSLRRRIIRGLNKKKQIYLNDELQGKSDFHLILSHEGQMIREEDFHRLCAMLAEAAKSLSSKQREAIFLKFHNNLSYKEIAEVMKLNLPDVYKTISRAVDKLKQGIVRIGATLYLVGLFIAGSG